MGFVPLEDIFHTENPGGGGGWGTKRHTSSSERRFCFLFLFQTEGLLFIDFPDALAHFLTQVAGNEVNRLSYRCCRGFLYLRATN